MEKRNYSRGGGGGSGCGRGVSGGGRAGPHSGRGGNSYQRYHQGQSLTGGGAGISGGGGGNNYQQHNQGQYQSGGSRGRRGRGGGRSGAQMGTNPPRAQPWGDRPVQGGRVGTQMGTSPTRAQPWGYRPVQGGEGRNQRPEYAMGMGQGAGATGGRGAWSGGPPRVAGRDSWASAIGGGAGAGHAQRKILYLFLFLSMFMRTIHVSFSRIKEGIRVILSLRGQFWTKKIVYPFECDFYHYRINGTSESTCYYVLYDDDEHNYQLQKLIYQLVSPMLDALRPSLLSLQFTVLPLLPIVDEWRCSLLLQLHNQLLSHHHRLHLRLHLTIRSANVTQSSKT